MKKIVNVKSLNVSFPSSTNKKELVQIVRDVDLSVYENQIVGFIGESGSGKSVTAKSLLGINNNSITKAESIDVDGISLLTPGNILTTSKKTWKKIRGKRVAYIPQDSLTSLNPTMRIGSQITEAMRLHGDKKEYLKELDKNKGLKQKQDLIVNEYKTKINEVKIKRNKELDDFDNKMGLRKQPKNARKQIIIEASQKIEKFNIEIDKIIQENKIPTTYGKFLKNEAIKILQRIGIEDAEERIDQYPHQFSGGMRQRVIIAMMVACGPDLIIADEPTTALDPTVQSSVMALFQDIVKRTKISIILISHDIAVIAKACDYLYIFYAGSVVEKGTKKDIFTKPAHPYTWSLLSAIPDGSINKKGKKLFTIAGQPPSFDNLPKGDPFSVRNPYAMKIDFQKRPPLFKITNSHYAATWLLHPNAPKVEMPKQIIELIKITSKDLKNAKNK